MSPITVNPMCPEGIKSPHEEKERPSEGICEITAVEKGIQTDSCGGWKVLPGRQWGAGPGSSVTHSQKARTR